MATVSYNPVVLDPGLRTRGRGPNPVAPPRISPPLSRISFPLTSTNELNRRIPAPLLLSEMELSKMETMPRRDRTPSAPLPVISFPWTMATASSTKTPAPSIPPLSRITLS